MLEALKNKVKNYGFSGFLVNTESFALITGVSFEKRWLAAARYVLAALVSTRATDIRRYSGPLTD